MFGRETRKALFLLFIFIAVCCLISCRKDVEEPNEATNGLDRPTVYVVNYPLQYFTQRIGGEFVNVEFPAPANEDPAFWKPDSGCIEAYQNADLIFLNGATYAKWIDMVSLPTSKMIDTSEAFHDKYIQLEQALTHAHGPEGEHAHGAVAFTTWLDPTLAIQHAEAINKSLTRLLPNKADVIEQNYAALKIDLEDLDKRFNLLIANYSDESLLASHPVYQYMARHYKLNLKSIHWEPDEIPQESQWREINELLETHPAKWIIWEDKPLYECSKQLEEIGILSVVFNPCSNKPGQGDYMTVMYNNIKNLKTIFDVNP
ncbi:MAG: metal ABC transporter substrate-binding protein [Planctomycetota bacterium]|jgi:zinc transport system substrate-binding protein